jgi:hypothetical protein
MSENVKTEIKSWITPGLLTIFWAVSWSAWNEMRSDMKKLLEAKAQTEYRLPALEKRVDVMEHKVESIQNVMSHGVIQSQRR